MNKRLAFRIGLGAIIMVIGLFLGEIVSWTKLSSTTPISEVERNVYLRDVDSNFVKKYGLKYEKHYTYFLRGDLVVNTYRGDSFLSTKIVNDTTNVVLDKKIKKEVLKPVY